MKFTDEIHIQNPAIQYSTVGRRTDGKIDGESRNRNPNDAAWKTKYSTTRIYRISADCEIYPIYTRELLFCTMGIENFIRLSDITESDISEFSYMKGYHFEKHSHKWIRQKKGLRKQRMIRLSVIDIVSNDSIINYPWCYKAGTTVKTGKTNHWDSRCGYFSRTWIYMSWRHWYAVTSLALARRDVIGTSWRHRHIVTSLARRDVIGTSWRHWYVVTSLRRRQNCVFVVADRTQLTTFG